jgi:hypothetical protein
LPRPERYRNDIHRRDVIRGRLVQEDQNALELQLRQRPQTSFDVWGNLVLEYRARYLTFSKHRNVALVGVARRFASIHSLTYLAGTLLQHMPDSLLWLIKKTNDRHTLRELPNANVPSWSWFSAPIYDKGHHKFKLAWRCESNDDQTILSRVLGFLWDGRAANVIPDDGLYNFSGLSLILEAIILPAVLSKQVYSRGEDSEVYCGVSSEEMAGYTHHFWPDLVEGTDLIVESSVDIHLAIFRSEHMSRVDGLVLVPGPRKDTWKRVGYWSAQYLPDSRAHCTQRLMISLSDSLTFACRIPLSQSF